MELYKELAALTDRDCLNGTLLRIAVIACKREIYTIITLHKSDRKRPVYTYTNANVFMNSLKHYIILKPFSIVVQKATRSAILLLVLLQYKKQQDVRIDERKK